MMTAEIINLVEYRKKKELRDELESLSSNHHITDQELEMMLLAMLDNNLVLDESEDMIFWSDDDGLGSFSSSDNYDLSTINYTITFAPDDNLTISISDDDDNDLEPLE